MKNIKYILAIASLFMVFHIMELVLFPTDYKQEINMIKADVDLIEQLASKSESSSFLGM